MTEELINKWVKALAPQIAINLGPGFVVFAACDGVTTSFEAPLDKGAFVMCYSGANDPYP